MSIIYRRIDEAGQIVRDREDPSACGLRMTGDGEGAQDNKGTGAGKMIALEDFF